MEFTFSPQWVYKLIDGKVNGFICNNEADFKVLLEGGYTDHPKAAEKKEKHSVYEYYFEKTGSKKPEVKEPETDISIKEVEALNWPSLKKYAKQLEGVFKTDIVSRHSKREDVISKIKELRNADSTSTDK